MGFAAVFPGQGSQAVGMLSKFSEEYPIIKQTFTEASENLGYDLWALTQQGPEERLNATQRTQPALLTAGVAVWRVWQAQGGPQPAVLAGHSLGEYTALVCAGALDFQVAVKLVEYRGQVMQEAVPAGEGAMAAIIGLDDEAVRAACAEAAQGQVVEAVNFNAPGQVVIAGNSTAVERAGEACKARGAKRALPLPVSAPSHCALMLPAAAKLAQRLAEVNFDSPAIPVIHNVDVSSHIGAEAIRAALKAQLHNPVRWVETVQRFASQGVTRLVELGPGRVLSGLAKRIDKNMEAFSVNDQSSLEAALEAVAKP
ncbi:MAG: ACP S-malonyltransferase [Gammaproteobacteria bacterium]